jgi:hypothetical protein
MGDATASPQTATERHHIRFMRDGRIGGGSGRVHGGVAAPTARVDDAVPALGLDSKDGTYQDRFLDGIETMGSRCRWCAEGACDVGCWAGNMR